MLSRWILEILMFVEGVGLKSELKAATVGVTAFRQRSYYIWQYQTLYYLNSVISSTTVQRCRSRMLSTVTKAHLSILQVPQVVPTVVQPIYRVLCPPSCGLSLFVRDYLF
jgi:hypothetical protein